MLGSAPAEKTVAAGVRLESVVKTYKADAAPVVRGVSLEIQPGELFILLGPSGCGKSTLLRMIAGLEDLTSGDLFIGDRRVNAVPPKDRDIAMVFQSYALYPHMTVAENMAFGLKLRGVAAAEIQKRTTAAAEALGLTSYLKAHPRELSGGQRQRVALGRAIVREPAVFLLDEPLSNLDAKLRGGMRAELKRLHERLKATMIYVTHDQVEAMTLGDRVAVIDKGLIQQVGTPLEVYDKPKNRFVAGFLGSPPMNFVPCTVRDGALDRGAGARIELPLGLGSVAPDGSEVDLGIRAEDLAVTTLEDGGRAPLAGTVAVTELLGDQVILTVDLDGSPALSLVAKAPPTSAPPVGARVSLTPNLDRAHLFARGDEGASLTRKFARSEAGATGLPGEAGLQKAP
jgi:ABC-type sugar transport system ATPase subunit